MRDNIRPAKTSIDILGERNVLRARVKELEAAVRAVKHETEQALRRPQVSFLTLCRIRSVAWRAVGEHDDA